MKRFHYEQIDSTNEEAKRLLSQGLINGQALLTAEHQTAGRGTRGRVWQSPPRAGLYMTTVQAFSDTQAPWPADSAYTLAVGVACAETLEALTGLRISLKPINDLYLQQRKLGGILTESSVTGGGLRTLITGVGINLLHAERPLPLNSVPAICLEACFPSDRLKKLIACDLAEALARNIFRWQERAAWGETDTITDAWEMYRLSPQEAGVI